MSDAEVKRKSKTDEARTYLYPSNLRKLVDTWLSDMGERQFRPDDKQMTILRTVAGRCLTEATEERSEHTAAFVSEPERILVHGLPGSGKSAVIGWLRELFEKVLKWRSGTEFQCAAPMNSMAALIGGTTVHKLGHLQIDLIPDRQIGGVFGWA